MNPDGERLDGADRAWLSLAIDPVTPADAVRRRARERVLALAASAARGVRCADGDWRGLLPGIEVKRLRIERDHGVETCLWRLAPGAVIPRHPHRVGETCLVVAGEVELDGERWTTGDWIEIASGGDHGVVRTATGALLMITGEPLPVFDR
jgi:anti-sigma factor ChrR (cupin superfamily)